MRAPATILADIEGTTTPISFVHETLFPYAHARLDGFLALHAHEAEIQAAFAELAEIAPGAPPVETLRALMDIDAKVAPLKTIQGLIWAEGYAKRELKGALYTDVPPAFRLWSNAGLDLNIYSSGSQAAQELLFRHSVAGDLTILIRQYFDTRFGGKRESQSYLAIADALQTSPADILFLSDVELELDAAAQAGLQVCQLVREADGTQACAQHPSAPDFDQVAALFGLPRL